MKYPSPTKTFAELNRLATSDGWGIQFRDDRFVLFRSYANGGMTEIGTFSEMEDAMLVVRLRNAAGRIESLMKAIELEHRMLDLKDGRISRTSVVAYELNALKEELGTDNDSG